MHVAVWRPIKVSEPLSSAAAEASKFITRVCFFLSPYLAESLLSLLIREKREQVEFSRGNCSICLSPYGLDHLISVSAGSAEFTYLASTRPELEFSRGEVGELEREWQDLAILLNEVCGYDLFDPEAPALPQLACPSMRSPLAYLDVGVDLDPASRGIASALHFLDGVYVPFTMEGPNPNVACRYEFEGGEFWLVDAGEEGELKVFRGDVDKVELSLERSGGNFILEGSRPYVYGYMIESQRGLLSLTPASALWLLLNREYVVRVGERLRQRGEALVKRSVQKLQTLASAYGEWLPLTVRPRRWNAAAENALAELVLPLVRHVRLRGAGLGASEVGVTLELPPLRAERIIVQAAWKGRLKVYGPHLGERLLEAWKVELDPTNGDTVYLSAYGRSRRGKERYCLLWWGRPLTLSKLLTLLANERQIGEIMRLILQEKPDYAPLLEPLEKTLRI